jgi:methyltransferase (TIGR00027 family)
VARDGAGPQMIRLRKQITGGNPSEVSSTARYMALFRALETARGRSGLFQDRSARIFLPAALRGLVAAARIGVVGRLVERIIDARWPGAWSSGVARTRLIDDWICDAVAAGARHLVILGAGFDCRASRLDALAGTPVFEVDRAALLADKQRRLQNAGSAVRPDVVAVPVDFLHDDLKTRLVAAGVRGGERTLFLWEGVTNYLDAASVSAVFDLVARIGGPGSRIIFTYVHAGVLTGGFDAPGLKALFARLEASGERWTFGFDPERLGDYLARHGLRLIADLGAADYRSLIMGERSRGLVGYEFYRVAMAEVAEARGAGEPVRQPGRASSFQLPDRSI